MSAITSQEVDYLIKPRIERDRVVSVEREYRDVNVRMLRVDWVFQPRDKRSDKSTRSPGDFTNLIDIMVVADDSIYKTDMVSTLVTIFWKTYRNYVIYTCLYPFIIYLIATIIYFSEFIAGVSGFERVPHI